MSVIYTMHGQGVLSGNQGLINFALCVQKPSLSPMLGSTALLHRRLKERQSLEMRRFWRSTYSKWFPISAALRRPYDCVKKRYEPRRRSTGALLLVERELNAAGVSYSLYKCVFSLS